MDMLKDEVIRKYRLLAIQESLIWFLLNEVVNPAKKHYYDRSKKIIVTHLQWE
jgi:hypothetical protein